jgi:hypothetical protein
VLATIVVFFYWALSTHGSLQSETEYTWYKCFVTLGKQKNARYTLPPDDELMVFPFMPSVLFVRHSVEGTWYRVFLPQTFGTNLHSVDNNIELSVYNGATQIQSLHSVENNNVRSVSNVDTQAEK